jgi:DNA-binding transcriptional LysR family regulator
MDRLDAMQAFVTVADRAGFAPAARKLGVSPSAVTRLVAALESRLGIRLLQRTTRSVTLTDAGARYLERARRILAQIDEAEGSAQAEQARPTGRLVVSAPTLFGRLHVSPVMCRFLAAHPQVTGELLLADRMVNLVEEGVDLALRIGHLEDSSLIARKAGETRRVLVASPRYLERQGTPGTPADLASHRTIQFLSLAPTRDWSFRDARVETTPHYVTNSADAALWHAEHDGGLTLALSYQVREAVQDGRLHIVLEQYEPPILPIQWVYPNSRLLSAKVRAFIEHAAHGDGWRFGQVTTAAAVPPGSSRK